MSTSLPYSGAKYYSGIVLGVDSYKLADDWVIFYQVQDLLIGVGIGEGYHFGRGEDRV